MAVKIAAANLYSGGAVVETSGGDKYAIFFQTNGWFAVWSGIDGTPNKEDQDTAATIFGGGSVGFCHAAIDSNDDIHIVAACTTDQTRDIAYCVFDTGTNTLGAWSEAASYTDGAPDSPGCSIAIDSNDYPRIVFVDAIDITGTIADRIRYTHDVGAGFITPEQVSADGTNTDDYGGPSISMAPGDDVEAVYDFVTDGDVAYNRRNGSWGTESVYTESGITPGFGGVTVTTGDTVYRYHTDIDRDIEENDVDTTYNSHGSYNRVSASLDGTNRYVFYIDISNDVHLISNDGSWNDEGALQTGTFTQVISQYSYLNNNYSGEISYIFQEDSSFDIYYDSFSLGPTIHYVSVAGGVTPAGALRKKTSRSFAGGSTPTGVVSTIRTAFVSLAGAITPTGTLANQVRFTVSLAGSIVPTGALQKLISMGFAGAIAPVGELQKLTSKTFSGETTPTGALANLYRAFVNVAGSITPMGILATLHIPGGAGRAARWFADMWIRGR